MSHPMFKAAMKSATLEILIYDEIGENYWSGGGITAATVAAAVKAAGTFDAVTVRINSPGGSAFDGVAIYNALRSLGKPVEVFVDGIAASAASVIAMAGDTINIGAGAMLMIHNAMWGVFGDAPALRKAADTIENISVTIAEIYVQRTKLDAAELKTLMDAETWMSGAEAIEKGFADNLVNRDERETAKALAFAKAFNMKPFQHAPDGWKKEVLNESVDPDCTCECTPCRTIGCSGCEDDPCTAEGCDCPNHQEMSSNHELDLYRRRLALRERAA